VSLSLNAFATQEASSWALCESFFDASVAPTDCISPPFKLAEVASSAAGLIQPQLASVNTTSAANGNLPSCTGDALISRFMGQVHAECPKKPTFLERLSSLWFVS
jgi:hypothetical protein